MKPIPGSLRSLIKLSDPFKSAIAVRFLVLFLISIPSLTSGQTIAWSESYQQGVAPTPEQRQKWTDFLNALSGKSFASVTLSGSYDLTGVSMTDPVAASELAALLASHTSGTVRSGGHAWTVLNCDAGSGATGVTLSVDGNETECLCADLYALRPHSTNHDWGGINSPSGGSCGAAAQRMELVFHSGVTIEGASAICKGGSAVLTAQSGICSGTLTYAWSNGATTKSIEVTAPGTFSVTVSDAYGCKGVSSPVTLTYADVSVTAEPASRANYCQEPVQLNAVGTSTGGVATTTSNKFCLFDSPDGGSGNCNFSSDNLCIEGLTEVKTLTSYSATATLQNPVELKYTVYYTAWYKAGFNFKLNGQQLGSFEESPSSDACNNPSKSFVFSQSEFGKYWNNEGENTVTIEVIGTDHLYIAALEIYVATSNVSYSWTPSEGLDIATIANPKASPLASTIYTVTYTDANGCHATDQVEVNVECEELPIAKCKALTVNADANCVASATALDFDDGSTSPSGLPLTYSISPSGPFAVGTTEVILTVTDSNLKSSSCITSVTVIDSTLPILAASMEVVVANDPNLCAATVTLASPLATDNCGIQEVVSDQTDNIFPVGVTTVTWTATDIHGNKQTATQLVTVTNIEPIINSVVASASTVAAGTEVILSITYADNNVRDAVIDWGDGSVPEIFNSPTNVFDVSHSYAAAGIYGVSIALTDHCEAQASVVYESIIVFDRRAGSVSGGGSFDSPPGAFLKNGRAEGKAHFSFDAEYNDYSDVPVGTARFTFRAADFQFKSSQFDLLLIEGETARLTGTGTVNGTSGYELLISMVDDDTKLPRDKKSKTKLKADRIRVKISDPSGILIYDTQPRDADETVASTHINAGSIEIKNNDFSTIEENLMAFSFGEETTSVHPNPFIDYVNVQFITGASEDIAMRVLDLTGRAITTATFPVSADGSYTVNIPETANAGIYLLTIRQGSRIEMFTVIKN